MQRVLTCPDTFWSSECSEGQAFVLHLFSTFIWAITRYIVSASQFNPTTVKSSRWIDGRFRIEGLPYVVGRDGAVSTRLFQLESGKIEALVQELHNIRLGAFGEIFKMLIPPLSHFNKLPNEALADWYNEMLIEAGLNLHWVMAFNGNIMLLNAIKHREVPDRFASRAAAIIVEFILRVTEDSEPFACQPAKSLFEIFNKQLSGLLENEKILQAILSLQIILASRGNLPKDEYTDFFLRLSTPLLQNALRSLPSNYALEEHDFSFPGVTNVFGWTKQYLMRVRGTVNPENGYNRLNFSTLDLAGHSALHHIIDDIGKRDFLSEPVVDDILAHCKSPGLLMAACTGQSLLHRAARKGLLKLVSTLLRKGADANATDFFGRTALCLAAHHGNFEVIKTLWRKMDHVGQNQKNGDDRNALYYAIRSNRPDAALFLIQQGISDIDAFDSEYKSPLWHAASKDMITVIKHLLDKGDIDFTSLTTRCYESSCGSEDSHTAREEANRAGHKEVAEMIGDREIILKWQERKPV